jgi:hypothetical protein
MARMTSAQMMGGFPTRQSTGAPMQAAPTGRTGPLPPGSGSHDFVTDIDGDQDGDVRATSGGPAKLPGGTTRSTTSLNVDMRK